MIYSHPNKKLYKHLYQVVDYGQKMIKQSNLNLTVFTCLEIKKINFISAAFHDFAKSTEFFQDYLFKGIDKYSHHGLLSAFMAYYMIRNSNLFDENKNLVSLIVFIIIRKHHGNLTGDTYINEKYLYDLKKQIKNILDKNFEEVEKIYSRLFKAFDISRVNILSILQKLQDDLEDIDDFSLTFQMDMEDLIYSLEKESEDYGIELFLIINYLYSLLIDSDKKSAADIGDNYFKRETVNLNVKKYIRSNFSIDSSINKLRDEFFNDINNFEILEEQKIYSLTAPTGIGKTLASFAFANNLQEKLNIKKMIYCLPYTSIIDQNYNVFEEVLKYELKDIYTKNTSEYLIKHHYLEFLEIKKESDNDSKISKNKLEYLNQKLLLESWESQNIVTTFVQLLESIISNKNNQLRKFHNIVNSVIILDEMQCIPIKYYYIIGKTLEVLSKRFNTYILLMTATQPDIVQGSKSIVDEEKYYLNEIFNRVVLDVSEINNEIHLEEFMVSIQEFTGDNCLIVVNTKRTAYEIYSYLNEAKRDTYIIKYLTTNLVPKDRMNRIIEIKEMLNNKNKIIVITTQLIEAGVDLSFKYVYRDLSPYDSIVQVAGRCNRNNEYPEKGQVKILNLITDEKKSDSQKIYDPKLLEVTKKIFKKNIYSNTEFYELSKRYFKSIRDIAIGESKNLISSMKSMHFTKAKHAIDTFKLINDEIPKARIVICKDKEVIEKIYEMENLKRKMSKKFDDDMIKKYEKFKKGINEYTVDVFDYELSNLKKDNLINEIGNILYITYTDQKKYIYSNEVGLLSKLKREKESSLMF